nr:efflux RND transporter periplasmic adaptor subunit [Alistipes hominis]
MMGGVPEYATITLEPTSIELNNTYPAAAIRGRQDIEIRPNVSGFITKLCVDEGATVKKGQTLFIIDPVQFEEAVKVAEANVNVAKAAVATAQLTADNKRELARKNIISEYDLQMAENTLASQKAALAQAEAQLTNAKNNLSYTQVTSPSNGVVGEIPYRVGSLVSPSMATPLTTVADNSEKYVYFSLNEKELLKMTTDGSLKKMPEVQLQLVDGSIYPEKGTVETLSGVIDQTAGGARVRATFKNPNQVLRSGGSGNILIPEKLDSTIVIPQSATVEAQDKIFAFVVTDSSTVNQTMIQVLPINNGQQYVVTGGLNPGDRIVVEGVGFIKNGMPIKPITPEEAAAKMQQATQQAAAAAAAKGAAK